MVTISFSTTNKKRFLFFLATILFCANAFAQAKFYCRVSAKNIARNETLQVDYVIENAGSINDLQLPEFANFSVISGPNQSSESTEINGKSSSAYTISFLVQPKAPGHFSIPTASARINDKTMSTTPVTVEVGNRTSKNPQQPQQMMPSMNMAFPQMDMPQELPDEDVSLGRNEKAEDKIKKNLLVVLQVSKQSCYVGEPIVATYKLCSRLKSESRVTKRPSLDGFSVYDMVDMQNVSPTTETINGKQFIVHIIRKVQLYPLQAGTFTLDPVELDNNVRFLKEEAPARRQSNDPLQQMMDGFTNQHWEEHQVTLASKPVVITVKPLPDNKPESFNGAVGKFTVDAKLSTNEVHAEDDATLNVTINGAGNLPLVNAPVIHFPKGFESFDAAVKEDVDKTVAPITGNKKFDFTFVPSDTGSFKIDSITFSYFDPASESYKTIATPPLTINVLKAIKQRKKGLKGLIAPNGVAAPDFTSWWYWVAGGVLIVLLLAIFMRRKKKPITIAQKPAPVIEKKEPEPVKQEPVVPAYAANADPLEESRKALNNNDSRLFFSTIQKTLWTEVSRKTNIPESQLNKRVALQILEQKGVSDTVRTELENLLNTCEMALYMPHSASDMQNVLYKTNFVVNALRN